MIGGKYLSAEQRRAYREAAEREAAAAGFVPEYPGETPNSRYVLNAATSLGLVTTADIERAERAVRQELAE